MLVSNIKVIYMEFWTLDFFWKMDRLRSKLVSLLFSVTFGGLYKQTRSQSVNYTYVMFSSTGPWYLKQLYIYIYLFIYLSVCLSFCLYI
jgi:hypothetical protein